MTWRSGAWRGVSEHAKVLQRMGWWGTLRAGSERRSGGAQRRSLGAETACRTPRRRLTRAPGTEVGAAQRSRPEVLEDAEAWWAGGRPQDAGRAGSGRRGQQRAPKT